MVVVHMTYIVVMLLFCVVLMVWQAILLMHTTQLAATSFQLGRLQCYYCKPKIRIHILRVLLEDTDLVVSSRQLLEVIRNVLSAVQHNRIVLAQP
jgi:hypothetical protein